MVGLRCHEVLIHLALIFTPVTNLFLCGGIVSTSAIYNHNNKRPRSIALSRDRYYGLQLLLTVLITSGCTGGLWHSSQTEKIDRDNFTDHGNENFVFPNHNIKQVHSF